MPDSVITRPREGYVFLIFAKQNVGQNYIGEALLKKDRVRTSLFGGSGLSGQSDATLSGQYLPFVILFSAVAMARASGNLTIVVSVTVAVKLAKQL